MRGPLNPSRPKCFNLRRRNVLGSRFRARGPRCERSAGSELTWHSVDGSQGSQHANRPHGGKADTLQVEGVLQHPAGKKERKMENM